MYEAIIFKAILALIKEHLALMHGEKNSFSGLARPDQQDFEPLSSNQEALSQHESLERATYIVMGVLTYIYLVTGHWLFLRGTT